jgi:hypothetical protein
MTLRAFKGARFDAVYVRNQRCILLYLAKGSIKFLNPYKIEQRERERRESGWVVRDTTFKRGKQSYVYGYLGPQAVPASPFGKGGLERK